VNISTGERSLVVAAGLAGIGVVTLFLPDRFAGVTPMSVSVLLFAGLVWQGRHTQLGRRLLATTLTGVSALAAAGWGLALTGGVESVSLPFVPFGRTLVGVAAVGIGTSVLAGAGAGYYGARLRTATPPENLTAGEQHSESTPDATRDTSNSSQPSRSSQSPHLSTDRDHTSEDRIAEQKRAFYFLNNLLRHHVLNGLNVIDGYAQRIDGGTDEEVTEQATRVIRERTETMTTVVQNVRAIADVFSGDPELTRVDLTTAVAGVRSRAADQYPNATVTATMPETATVWAAGGSDVVIWELVENGIVHNDGDPTVHLHLTTIDDDVWVYVVDDGPGISPDETDDLFEPGTAGDQGLGMYLARTLVRYGRGEVSVHSPDTVTDLPGVETAADLATETTADLGDTETDLDRAGGETATERLETMLDDNGTCVALQFAHADGSGEPPEAPAVDETMGHAIARRSNQ
jgi:signal transduction histidine kinase